MDIEGAAEKVAGEEQALTRVVVTDVDISFSNMIGLLVKLAFAAIPAAIIVALIVMVALKIAGSLPR